MNTVPSAEHHILCPAVNSHQIVSDYIPTKQAVYIEVVGTFCTESGRIILYRINPCPKTGYGIFIILIGIFPRFVWFKTKFQTVSEVFSSYVGSAEKTQRMRVIQELKANTLITVAIQSGYIIESGNTLKTINIVRIALFVIEIVLTQIGIYTGIIIIVEQVHRKTVNTDTNAAVYFLWGCQPATFLPCVIDQSHTTSIVR